MNEEPGVSISLLIKSTKFPQDLTGYYICLRKELRRQLEYNLGAIEKVLILPEIEPGAAPVDEIWMVEDRRSSVQSI